MKLIQILHHSMPVSYSIEDSLSLNEDDWHVRVARQILKFTDRYEIECWRPERRAKSIIIGKKGEINYKIFPSVSLADCMEYSGSMLKEIRNLSKKEEIIIHLHGIYNLLSFSVPIFFKDMPIIGQDHGARSYFEGLRISKHPLRFLYFPPSIIESRALRNIDYFFVLTNHQKKILGNIINNNIIKIQTMGVDFNRFRPMEKARARELLNLSIDNKIILYVGRFDETKRFDLIIKIFNSLKNKYKIDLIAIGGRSSDSLYNEAIASGAYVIERIPSENLVPYYCSADVYCCFYKSNLWGGTGIAPVESLGCGTPVVSNTLEHFPEMDRRYIGEMPKNEGELEDCLIKVIEDKEKYNRCREIAMKYYNWETIIRDTLKIYEDISRIYY